GIAEEPFRGRIEGPDDAVEILTDDAIVRGVDDCGEVRAAGLRVALEHRPSLHVRVGPLRRARDEGAQRRTAPRRARYVKMMFFVLSDEERPTRRGRPRRRCARRAVASGGRGSDTPPPS